MSAAPRATLLVLLGLAACGGDGAPDPTPVPGAGGEAPAAADLRAERTAAALDQWNEAEVKKRLEEAGLVVADSGSAPATPSIEGTAERLWVSGSELRLFVFSDAAARARASTGLDTAPPPLGYATVWRERPRVFVVNNIVALLYTPNDRLAERVENVLRARHLGR